MRRRLGWSAVAPFMSTSPKAKEASMSVTRLIPNAANEIEAEGARRTIEQLHTMAALVEEHPWMWSYVESTRVSVWFSGPEPRRTLRERAREIGGLWHKRTTDYAYVLERELPDGVKLRLLVDREAACHAKEVEKPVEKEVPVDEAAAAELEKRIEELRRQQDALPREKRTVVEKVVEWDCPTILDGDPDQQVTA